MAMLLCTLGGAVLGSFLQVRALGSQDIWADMRRIFNEPNPLNANPTNHVGDPIQGDAFHRLTKYPNKTEVSCPKQTERTMVLLISGQSNSANHGGQRYASQYGDKIINYFDGKCYIAKSPLLGATGLEGDSWTLLGNLLIQQGVADQVILAPTGIADALRQQGMDAPIYVSQTSQCWMDANWRADNPVTQAQRALISPERKIFAGVNSDALLGELDRFDNCHFAGTGQEKFARAWLNLLAR